MKSKLIKYVVVSLASMSLAACIKPVEPTPEVVAVESVTLNKNKLAMVINTSEQLQATVLPENATNKAVRWSVNGDCVTVDNNGLVTATKLGEAIVTVSTLDQGKTARCEITVVDEVEDKLIALGPVTKRESFINYAHNIQVKEEKKEEFIDREQGYSVGYDNPVNFLPQFGVLDEDLNEVPQSEWKHDYEFTVKVKTESGSEDALPSQYEVVDARNCDVKFSAAANGKTFLVTVMPGGLTDAQKANPNYKVTYEVNVVEGYNVYNAKELSYLDNRHGNGSDGDWHSGDVANIAFKWDEFKDANGLDKSKAPKALILHDNLTLTKDDVPAELFYNREEAQAAGDQSIVGTLKDTANIYGRFVAGENITLNGNYFKISIKDFPLITRFRGEASSGSVDSHTALVRVCNGEFHMKNLNIEGNSPKAETQDDIKYQGGLMLVKAGRNTGNVSFTNSITRSCYINLMTEEVNDPNLSFTVDKCRNYDNFNCFYYNWGGTLTVSNSVCEGAGGPIVIQDHVGENDKYEIESTYYEKPVWTIVGRTPTTTFIDCELRNYVAGTEQWFVKFNAAGLVPTIKAMSDLFLEFGKAYACDGDAVNPQGVIVQMGGVSYLNLIAVNKAGAAEGMTNIPVCGNVTIINNKTNVTNVFDYAQPEIYMLEGAIEIQGFASQDPSIIAALMQKYGASTVDELVYKMCVAYGVSSVEELGALAQSYSDQYGVAAALHTKIREVNKKGGPAFYTGSQVASINDAMNKLNGIDNAGNRYDMTSDDPFVPSISENICLYYYGMSIVLGMYNAPQIG